MIPGLNDVDDSIAQLSAELRARGVESITLLPYNHFWEAKLPRLATDQTRLGIVAPPPTYYADVEQRFASNGITAQMI